MPVLIIGLQEVFILIACCLKHADVTQVKLTKVHQSAGGMETRSRATFKEGSQKPRQLYLQELWRVEEMAGERSG